jgi:protein MpaA
MLRRGTLADEPVVYGYSVERTPLHIWLPADGSVEVLVFAGIHGEEPDTTVLLSRALRCAVRPSRSCAVILCANPDGAHRGTRGNANGVDLNRNFPSSNWTAEPVQHRWNLNSASRVELSTGEKPCSEPEVLALTRVIEELQPECVVSVHSPLGLVDDPDSTDLGRTLAEWSGMPRTVLSVDDTPGSFGSWARDKGMAAITYELPNMSVWDMLSRHLPIFSALLENGLSLGKAECRETSG